MLCRCLLEAGHASYCRTNIISTEVW